MNIHLCWPDHKSDYNPSLLSWAICNQGQPFISDIGGNALEAVW